VQFVGDWVQQTDLTSVDAVHRAVVVGLCGDRPPSGLTDVERRLLRQLLDQATASGSGLNHAQVNELLLLLNQDRIGPDFYRFFFQLTLSSARSESATSD
jgi:hypothetical protein